MVKFDAENGLLAHPGQYYITTTLLDFLYPGTKVFFPGVDGGIAVCQFSCMTLNTPDTHS